MWVESIVTSFYIREITILRKQLGFSENKVSFGRVRGLVEAYCIFRGKCITGKAPQVQVGSETTKPTKTKQKIKPNQHHQNPGDRACWELPIFMYIAGSQAQEIRQCHWSNMEPQQKKGALEEAMLETRPQSRGCAHLIVRVELRVFQLSCLLINIKYEQISTCTKINKVGKNYMECVKKTSREESVSRRPRSPSQRENMFLK